MTITASTPPTVSARWAWWVFVVAVLAQLPLILNPGYFSHDELQWAARADVASGAPMPWFPWTAIDIYQYRPLTFNLWLWLSRQWFEVPQVFHAVCVLWGSANAMLLAILGRRLGMRVWSAAAGALAFALGPYAVFVHGWVGTMADLIWLSCALLIGLIASSGARPIVVLIGAAALTAIGLLGKEAAITIPPLLAVAWLFDRDRRRAWFAAAIGAGVICASYLWLRADALLQTPRDGAQYKLSLSHPPLRWVEYQLFAQIPDVFETFNTLARGLDGRVAIAVLLWLALCAALWTARPRLLGLFLVGGAAALFAVLPLGSSWNHYGYGYAALTAMVVAAAWSNATRLGRAIIALMGLLTVTHGAVVMLMMYRVGQIQATFSPALADAVAAADTHPLRLRIASGPHEWVFRRLTHEIPSYRHVPIGARIELVDADAAADYVIEADGRLTPVQSSLVR